MNKTRKFKSGQFSLRTRVNKKLTEKYNWFRVNKVNIDDETVSESVNNSELSKKKNKWHHYSKKHAPIEALEKVETKDAPPQAVLFVQFTENSELASRIRDVIQKLKPWTGINLKVIERVGEKLEDLIHQSNPWENVDCNRVDCFTCQSSARSEDMKFKSCKKRSVVYQTWCQTCLDIKKLNDKPDCELDCEPSVNLGNMVNDQKVNYCEDSESKKLQKLELEGAEHMEAKDEIDKQDNRLVVGGIINVETEMLQNEKLVKNAKNAKISKKRGREIEQNGPLYLYIGETSRSAYERGQEHLKHFEFK